MHEAGAGSKKASRRLTAHQESLEADRPCVFRGRFFAPTAQPSLNPKLVSLWDMQISELATRADVSVHAIRHWERFGLITAQRRPSGYREFDESVIRELRFITMSRQCGFTLAQIAEVLPAYRSKALTSARMIAMLQGRIAEVDAEIAKRQALRKHLVSHIDWFCEREQRAGKKSGFPRVPSRRGTEAGVTGKTTRSRK